MGGLRERIELDPLAVGDGFGDIGVAPTLEIGTQENKASCRSSEGNAM